jgi:glycosyltransferase involved in cell wall biosynthesis
MPGSNVWVDARVMKNLRTAAELGYDAIGLGISRGETVAEDTLPGGGRVVVQPVHVRYEAWRRYRRTRVFFDRTDWAIGRSYARHLYQAGKYEADRALRDAERQPSVARPRPPSRLVLAARQAHSLFVRGMVRARSTKANAEIRRDSQAPGALEAWRQRRFRLLRLTPWRARWRHALPEAVDQAIDLGPQLDRLEPDIVHVHDVYMMHVAAAYAARAARAGRRVRLVYDAREYVPGLAHVDPLRVEAYARLEKEFMPAFDRVISVSQPMADLVARRHGLLRAPDIVMNAPMEDLAAATPSLREAAGVPEGVPLAVYGGVVNPARGLGTVLAALARPELADTHLALVVNNRGEAVRHLLDEARRLGLADRLHLVPYVPHDQVTRRIASADVGLSPLSHVQNHDVTVTNKFCEYIVAGLPVVTSDTPAQAALVRELGVGTVFRADDAPDCARAIREALDRREEFKARLAGDPALRHRFTWDAQAEVLARVYAEEAAALGLAAPGAEPGAEPGA